MTLDKDFFNRPTNITVRVICDSINNGNRVTTFEIEAPRIILAEINTHNAISKNCSSTRAITLQKAISQVEENGFEPLYVGKRKTGMSATEEVEDEHDVLVTWEKAKQSAINHVKVLDDLELHKQISGRLLEPFQMIKQVITATDWHNFFNLRIHPTTQPEFLMLAYKIYQAMQESTPCYLYAGQWHLPYVGTSVDLITNEIDYFIEDDGVKTIIPLEQAKRISASCCAQVSFRNTDMSLEKADKIYNMLVQSDVLHASCFEHLATPIADAISNEEVRDLNIPTYPRTWEKGITHVTRNGKLCSANFKGWIQYRHLLDDNTCYKFDFDERIKLFDKETQV